MREHGVLKRVLLIYREGIRRLQAGDQAPVQALNAGAGIIRSFIEDYHCRRHVKTDPGAASEF